MRVCMLTYFYWPANAGGAENQCRRLAAQLVQNGHNCRVLTGRHDISVPGSQAENGVRIIRCPTFEIVLQRLRIKPLYTKDKVQDEHEETVTKYDHQTSSGFSHFISSMATKVVRFCNASVFGISILIYLLINKKSLDVIHVHTAEWIAGVAYIAGYLTKTPVVCKGANLPVFPDIEYVPLGFFLENWRKKNHFIALTQAMKNDLLENGVPENKITVIPNGVQVPRETASVAENTNFLYIGNFSQTAAHKGFDILIKAWSIVHQAKPTALLTMLGGGDARSWIDLANELGCGNSIRFEGYQDELASYYISACCLLLPSRKEGISNALLEAQSWGIPAIVSDIPGNREVIIHRENGLVIPVDDYIALSEACISLFDKPWIRQQYGKAARKRMEAIFAMEKVAQQTVQLYEELVHGQ